MTANAEQILLAYYRLSFPTILGIDFPSTFDEARRYRDVNDYLLEKLSKSEVNAAKIRLEHYQREIAPSVKTRPLLDFLNTYKNLRPLSLLDFGCGSGYTLAYLVTRLKSLRAVWGIDRDPDALTKCKRLSALLNSHVAFAVDTQVDKIPKQSCCDLIVAIHTFHHIKKDEQNATIDRLLTTLSPRGILYLYEDSWSEEQPLEQSNSIDKRFWTLSTQQKIEVFKHNEYWANNWCYGRALAIPESNYRSFEEWKRLLSAKGLKIVAGGVINFDVRRLHGVPSAWLIAMPLSHPSPRENRVTKM